ncbi:MAG: DUF357 domain-containing protein [Methanomicrobium sp.]|nr:DUF357 domain-containing protein [Methanomicrobium sp.]MDD4300348.1 DUF357 domain-containing protein [Methanomicrobium sp.]
MKPEKFGELLEEKLLSASALSLPDTPYSKLSEEILEMAKAYQKDGFTFLASGDIVNAHASFAYGFGWLDFGVKSGLIDGLPVKKRVPFFAEEMPQNLLEHLFEKTNRYQRMLSEALCSVSPAPDAESPLYAFSKDILKSADEYLKSGELYLNSENYVSALAHFSYGYGLLDASVRSGLFIINKNRGLFTV